MTIIHIYNRLIASINDVNILMEHYILIVFNQNII